MSNIRVLIALFMIVVVGSLAPIASAHYRPGAGRWLERDPAGYDKGMSFEFASSNPNGRLDSFGLFAVAVIDIPPANLPEPHEAPVVEPWWPLNPHLVPDPGRVGQEAECCKKARPSGTTIAEVICCAGRKIICHYRPARYRYPVAIGTAPYSWRLRNALRFALSSIDACTLEHERRHVGQEWTGCDNVKDGDTPLPFGFPFRHLQKPADILAAASAVSRIMCEHCAIWAAHKRCLEAARENCARFRSDVDAIASGECYWLLSREIANAASAVSSLINDCEAARKKRNEIYDRYRDPKLWWN